MNKEMSLDELRLLAQQDIRELRDTITRLDEKSIQLILTRARSHYAWQNKPVDMALLQQAYDIMKMGPTSMNTCPARITFVVSDEAKQRIAKSLKPANVPKVLSAPVTAIFAYDVEFWKELLQLFPHEDRRGHFDGKEKHSEDTAFRNSTLQGAYFMIALRALGLDVGPISGFDNAIIDEEFFAGTSVKSNFLCNIGYGDETALFQRLPRMNFDQYCEVL